MRGRITGAESAGHAPSLSNAVMALYFGNSGMLFEIADALIFES